MTNARSLIVALMVLVGGVMLSGCASMQAPPELVTAVKEGDIEKVRSIVEENPKLVNSRYERSPLGYGITTPLDIAVFYNNKDMVNLLLENGADESLSRCRSPLYWLMCSVYSTPGERRRGAEKLPHAEDMAIFLINSGADVKKKCKGWGCKNLLMCATESEWYEIVKLLIDKGVNVNAKGRSTYANLPECTALHCAVFRRHKEIAEFLIENGANVNVKDSKGRTPLYYTIGNDNKEIADLLRKHGAVEQD